MIKVEPKPFVSPSGKTINIVGINARFVNLFPVSFSPIPEFQFYIEYMTEGGEARDSMNATSTEFLVFLQSQGMTEEQASGLLNQVFGSLLVGTREQRFEAIASLVSFYGYTLLPIEEQD